MPELPCVDLVHCPPYGEVPFKHLGLCYIAAALRKDGFDTRYHDISEESHRAGTDFNDELILRLSRYAGDMSDLPQLDLLGEVLFPEYGDSALAGMIRTRVDQAVLRLENARVVCLSFNTITSYFAAALGRALRQRNTVVLLGGPLSFNAPTASLMLHLGVADALITGDGELHVGLALRALINRRPPRGVPGARWMEDGSFHTVPPCPPLNLDSLAWPLLDGNNVDLFVPLLASRGCTRSCAYCFESGRGGVKGYRRRSPKNVVVEMRARASEYNLTDFHFHDDLLNGSRQWMDELVRELSHMRYTWECFFEPYGLDAALMERMRDAGCRCVKLGIQSFSPPLLQLMKRPPQVEQIIDTVVQSYRLGISTHYDMITGHPGETDEDHQCNLATIEKLYQKTGDRLLFSINPFVLSAGSEIERCPERYRITLCYANPSDYAPPIAHALRAVDPYLIGYRSEIPREKMLQRIHDMSAILRRRGGDHMFLGQQDLPKQPGDSRTMLPSNIRKPKSTVREARAAGDADLSLPTIVLSNNSNLRLHPDPGRIRILARPGCSPEAYAKTIESFASRRVFRILGGEATIEKTLVSVLAAAQRLHHPCVLETNGLRLSQSSFVNIISRYKLFRAVVLLLGLDRETADNLGGVPGSFDLAIDGARQLVAAGIPTELGVVLSESTLDDLPHLFDLSITSVPGNVGLRVVIAKLIGPDAPALPDPSRVDASVGQLIEATQNSQSHLVLEDRR